MAFPNVQGTNTYAASGGLSDHTVNMPSGTIVSGDLLLVFVAGTSNAALSIADGTWHEIFQTANGTATNHAAFYKIATGDVDSVTVHVASASKIAAVSYWINSWHGTTPPESGSATTGTDTHPDPPACTPSWGSSDILFIESAAHGEDATFSSASTNYTNLVSAVATGGSAGSRAGCGTARRQVTGTTDNPDNVFTISASLAWVANLVAVRPAGAAGDVTLTGTKGAMAFTANTAAAFRKTQLADKATLTFSAKDATFRQINVLAADRGTLTLTAQTSSFIETLLADKSSLAFTGRDATFQELPGGIVLDAQRGTMTFSAQASLFTEMLGASPGSLVFDAKLSNFTETLNAVKNALSVTPHDSAFTETLLADKGIVTLASKDAAFLQVLALLAEKGLLSFTGQTANFTDVLFASKGLLATTGAEAIFSQVLAMLASKGLLTLTGNESAFAETLLANKGAFAFTGGTATFPAGYVAPTLWPVTHAAVWR